MLYGIPRWWMSFFKSTDSGFSRNICMQGNLYSELSIYSNKNKILSFPWWKWSNVIYLPSGSFLITLVNGAITGFSVGLCCWYTGHLAVVIARSSLLSESIHDFPSWYHGHFVHKPIEQWKGCPEEEADYFNHLVLKSFSDDVILEWSFKVIISYLPVFYPIQSSIHIPLPQISLPSIFLSSLF